MRACVVRIMRPLSIPVKLPSDYSLFYFTIKAPVCVMSFRYYNGRSGVF